MPKVVVTDESNKPDQKFDIFILEKKTKIALNQVFVLKLALKVKSHKNST